MKFPESVFDSLPRFHDKIKVSIQKIMKIFGPYGGIARSLAEIVDKKSRSGWLVINPEKYSWYIVENYYLKSNEKIIPSTEKKDKIHWLKNLYHLQFKDEEILRSPTAWLNKRIMDATQKILRKKLGTDDNYLSVLNIQKRRGAPYRVMKNEHIQQMHDGSGHWLLNFLAIEGSRFAIV